MTCKWRGEYLCKNHNFKTDPDRTAGGFERENQRRQFWGTPPPKDGQCVVEFGEIIQYSKLTEI